MMAAINRSQPRSESAGHVTSLVVFMLVVSAGGAGNMSYNLFSISGNLSIDGTFSADMIREQ